MEIVECVILMKEPNLSMRQKKINTQSLHKLKTLQ